MPGYKNEIQIIGNVSILPKLNYTNAGDKVVNFSMASNHYWVSNGEKKEEATYHFVTCGGRLVDLTENLLLRQYIMIEGRIKNSPYEKQCSCGITNKFAKIEVIANNIIFLSNKGELIND